MSSDVLDKAKCPTLPFLVLLFNVTHSRRFFWLTFIGTFLFASVHIRLWRKQLLCLTWNPHSDLWTTVPTVLKEEKCRISWSWKLSPVSAKSGMMGFNVFCSPAAEEELLFSLRLFEHAGLVKKQQTLQLQPPLTQTGSPCRKPRVLLHFSRNSCSYHAGSWPLIMRVAEICRLFVLVISLGCCPFTMEQFQNTPRLLAAASVTKYHLFLTACEDMVLSGSNGVRSCVMASAVLSS